jgi:CHAD domain-containing protein
VRHRGGSEGPGTADRFGDWAAGRLRDTARRFIDAVPADRADEAALHRLRIRGKELRYVMELLAAAFPGELRADLYPTVESMQDRLGRVNDLATACADLRRKSETAGGKAVAWRRLWRDEQARLDLTRREFWEWCVPPRLGHLRRRLEALCASAPAHAAPAA